MSAAQYCIVKNCLVHDNTGENLGGIDGIVGAFTYRCTIENNVLWNNPDDNIDMLCSFESTIRDNIVFLAAGGDGNGIKFSARGGGRHTVAGNIALNNDRRGFEGSQPGIEYQWREYYPSRIYGNLAYKSGWSGFSLGTGEGYNISYSGFEKTDVMNNLAVDNADDVYGGGPSTHNSDYNFYSQEVELDYMQSKGLDLNSLTGEAGLINPEGVLDTNFGVDWTIDEKLDYIRSQVREKFSLQADSQAIDNGTIIPGYHCLTAGETGDCVTWYGDAPDVGVYESGYSSSNECSGSDISCGTYPSCTNCNNSDGCYGTSYRDYYCISNSSGCSYAQDDCSDCSCSCGGYNTAESIANSNCNDGIDNDCDGNIDSLDIGCGIPPECTSGQTQSCDTGLQGICSTGTQTCQVNGTLGSCIQDNTATTEACSDSLDNDCDGTTDCSDTDCSATPACISTIPTDYISYWKFENNALDETGTNSGTLQKDATLINDPDKGNVLSFDGDGDKVHIGDIGGSFPEITVSAWIYLSEDKKATIIESYGTGLDAFRFYRHSNDAIYFIAYGTEGYDYGVAGSTPSLNTWYHVVGVYNGSSVDVYVNGIKGAITGTLSGNLNDPDANTDIGGDGDGDFNGLIDDVIIYDRALSESEIQAIYDAQKPASMAMAEPGTPDLSGLASVLDVIQEILNKLKNLF